MGKIITPAKRGITAVVSLNGIELGAQKTAQLMQTMSVINITNNINSNWTRNIAGLKSWALNCSGFTVKDENSFYTLQNAFSNGEMLTVTFIDGDSILEGKAFITSFPYNATFNDSCTYSLKFTGTGELAVASGQN